MPGIALRNFRGFKRAIIPFYRVNFFVGENSTGKSSVLSLLDILSSPNFYFSQELASEFCDFSLYEDAVSANSPTERMAIGYFRLSYHQTKKGMIDALVFHFFNNEGLTGIKSVIYISNGYLINVKMQKTLLSYSVHKAITTDRKAPVTTIPELMGDKKMEMQGEFVKSGKYKYNSLPLPSPLITALNILALENIKNSDKDPSVKPRINPTIFARPTWIAPIRAEPQAINQKNKDSYSPKGEHIPTLIREAFGQKGDAQLSKKINAIIPNFGKISHLFDSVGVYEYGKGPSSPFEVKINFGGAEHRISNLGYGVSQSLPILMEIASSSNSDSFVVQQPEVHLHPRAQAAFGDFFFEMAKNRDHYLYVETHSDFLIDRYRLQMHKSKHKLKAITQIIFFSQSEDQFNTAQSIRLRGDGSYPDQLPSKFKEFFLKEEFELISIR